MMVNPISNQPNLTAPPTRCHYNRALHSEPDAITTSQQGVIDSSTAEKRKQRDRRDLPKKASHQAGEKSPAIIEEDSEPVIDHRKESPKGDEEQTSRIDITV
jgi:hypothetical protein